MENLKGKRALVTGASQGLGKVIAEVLAKQGVHVYVNCMHNADKAQHVVDGILKAGGSAEVKIFDVSDEKAVNNLFRDLGGVDILVNNARLDPWRRTAEMTEGEWWDQVLKVNLKGTFLCCTAFVQEYQKRTSKWGRIVNISSVRSFRPAEPHMIAYGVSKLGMHGITRAFAQNCSRIGITVNTVAPGVVVTENMMKRLTPEKLKEELDAVPLGYGASCEQIADAVLFAIRNGYVTGETININGGMYYEP